MHIYNQTYINFSGKLEAMKRYQAAKSSIKSCNIFSVIMLAYTYRKAK
jgi:hypothetical protein